MNPQIENNFSYHSPKGSDPLLYESIREKAKEFAYMIDELCPKSREQSLAYTNLEQAVFWANASIAREQPIVLCGQTIPVVDGRTNK